MGKNKGRRRNIRGRRGKKGKGKKTRRNMRGGRGVGGRGGGGGEGGCSIPCGHLLISKQHITSTCALACYGKTGLCN